MRSVYSISVAAGVALTLATLGASAEPAECRSPNPSDWPAPAQPYFMLVLDSSGSMDTDVSGAAPSCAGYPDNRSGHARCAVYNTIQAFSGLVNFGLATFATVLEGCTGSSCYSGCDIRTFSPDEDGCGPSNGIAVVPSGGSSYDSSVTQREGANILVPIDPVTDGSDVPELLRWVDNDCTNSVEAAAEGYTPLGGVLRDIYRYFRYGWDRPDGAVSYSSPLDPSDPTCRSVNVILLTDGDEYCDPNTGSGDSGPAEEAARALAEGFRLAADDPARPLRRIPTYVINFAGGSVSDSNRIAEAGNTEESLFATNEADLSAALANIIAGAIEPEVCDNADNNCNGCTDEGYKVFCSRQWETASCCTWSTAAEREACLEDYSATIDTANPKGDRTQLPCWDPDTNGTSPETKWLCVDPGEACDDADNNCEWHYNQDPDAPGRTSEIDEGFTKCPECPVTEICDGQDNDCDGSIDEIPGCTVCIPSSEVCDGRDNDCDGYIDEASDNASDIVIPCSLAATPGCQGERACGHRYTSVDGDPLAPGAVLDPPNGYGPCDAPTSEETCNGQDDDCDGLIDEGDLGTPCDPPVPAGRSGIVYQDAAHPDTICKQGTVPCGGVACQGAVGPQPEVCDGQDNDCDGVVDQAWDGSPLPFEGDTCGPCGVGTKQCIDGEQRCVIEGTAPQEVCNGIDDDCDGVIDDPPLADAPATLACWPLDASQCDPSDVCTVAGTSWCKPTLGACQSMGSLSSPCAPGSLICAGEQGWTCHQGRVPTSEICDGVDNDCNGQIDESLGSPVGDTCGENIGTCTTGTIYCNNGVLQCNGTGPSPEVCNGEDDNCNGEVDEGLALGEPCWDNVDTADFPGDRTEGQCQPGHFVCDPEGSGELICDGGRGPEPEVCDGIDNDCDGNIDEAGPPPDGVDGTADPNDPTRHLGDECGDEEGVCEHGTLACVQGVVACQGGLGTQTEECDCVDNDCDGDIDEEPPALCSPGKSCVRFDDRCLCASPCASGEFPCPTGMECVRAKGSFDGDSGSFCVPEDPCGNCATRTVTDEQGNVECAPSYAAQDDNPVPVCVCKDEACHSPCFGIVCDKGQACVPTGWAAETCREENCYFFGCSADQLCLDGICRTDPCADDPCDEDEVCKPDASYKKPRCTKTCAGVECEDTEHCVEGLCMPTGCDEPCTGTDVCRSNANGDSECGPSLCELQDGRPTCSDGSYCNPTTGSCGDDPCEGVHCPAGQSCLFGECVIPDGSVSGAGGGTDSPDGGKVPKVSGNWGVATGGGGCGCRHSSGTKASWLFLLAGALLLRRRRRYGRAPSIQLGGTL